MIPSASLRGERDKKIKNLLSFASSTIERLNLNPIDPSLAHNLQSQNLLFPISAPAARSAELDAKGTELWNLSTRLNRSKEAPDKKTLTRLRVFAFGLLDSAHHGRDMNAANCTRLLKVAFKAGKFCLETGELEYAVKVLERAASYIDELGKERNQITPEDAPVHDRLKAEYFVLRTTLAWKQSKLDVAEHMFHKVTSAHIAPDPTSAEELADALYEIGKDLFAGKQFELAVRWLERAHDVLGEQELERLSDNAGELRLAIMQLLAKSMISLRTPSSLEKARSIVNLVDVDYSDKMVSSLLRLELLSSESAPNAEEYYAVLLRMFRTIPLTQPNFKTIMHHLHKLRKLSQQLACQALDDLLSLRLFEHEKREWIERASIMRIWIATNDPDQIHKMDSLSAVLDTVSANSTAPFSAAATHAAQTLLWKQIESAYTQKQYEVAESWCRLAGHELFEKCGDMNRAKIARKIILCALGRQEIVSAREAFFKMPESQQNSPQTRHLMYKIALRNGDTDLAAESLEIVCRSSGKDATLLYACVLEAQQVGDKKQAVAALQKVLERYEYNAPKGAHLPALLRCTARLIRSEIGTNATPSEETMEDLCKIFEGAATQARKTNSQQSTAANKVFNRTEVDWFSRNSYNIALEFCSTIHPGYLVRFCASCNQFIEILEATSSSSEKEELKPRRIFCEFLSMTANLVLARAEDKIEASLQHYISVRKHAQSLRKLIEQQLLVDALSEVTKENYIAKHFETVKYELEALLRLGKWDDLDTLFQECWRHEDPRRWRTLADLAFVINEEIVKAGVATTYQPKVLSFLQRIINRSWKTNSDITSLARWIRCLFQIALSSDENVSLHCVDQAISIAQKSQKTKTPFPVIELEWLATTSFNRAVDYYCAADDANSRMWAEKALTLAGSSTDNGTLRDLLQEKYSCLSWGKS